MPRESPTSAELGAAIRELRRRRELTIEALAWAARIHTTYLSGIERGERNPSWEKIRSIAAALEVDALALVRLAETLSSCHRR